MTLFFFSNFEIGGAQKIAINLINKLSEKDKTFKTIITINKSGNLRDTIKKKIKIHDFKKKRLIYCAFDYLKFINKYNVKKIFCVQPHIAIFCYIVNFFFCKKIKIIARETNSYKKNLFRKFSIKEQIFIYLKRLVYNNIYHVIYPSKGLKSEIVGKKTFIRNFVDIKFLKNYKKKNSNYLLGVGRLVEQKRFEDLINAYSLIHKNINEKLIIIGEGPEKQNLKNLIKKLKLKKKIKILPFKNYLNYLANCTVFVQTSAWEGMPNILIEAMVMEKKIVSTNSYHGPKEILQNGKYGSLCKIGDINSISRNILKELNTKKRKIPIKFINQFSINIAVKKYYKIFKK